MASAFSSGPKLVHPLPTASTSATVKIGHVQLRDLVQSTGPRGRIAYVTDKAIKEVDIRRGPQSTRTLAALDFQPNCVALSPAGNLLVAGGQYAELQFTTVAPPPHPSLTRRRTEANYGLAVSDEQCKASKTSSADDEPDTELDAEEVDESMGWSMDGFEATRTRRVDVRGAGYHVRASINNHVLVLGHNTDGGIFGQGQQEPDQTRIIVSNNDEYVRVFDVNTRESASSKEWGTMKLVGSVQIGTPANHVSVSPDGRTMLAVGDDTRLQIFSIDARSTLVDFDRVVSYTSGTEPNFTTAWSASGLQFASASQDGTITVWDVRSSRPLNSWRVPQRTGYRPHPPSPTPERNASPPSSYLGNGIRSLKFSPAGGNREMLVFTEHTAHIHIVDAQTFSDHQVIDVPRAPRLDTPSPVRDPPGLPSGAECGYPGIASGKRTEAPKAPGAPKPLGAHIHVSGSAPGANQIIHLN